MLLDDPKGSSLGYMDNQKQIMNARLDITEFSLIEYIKYLIGEQGNRKFTLNKEDYSQQFELGQNSIDKDFNEYIQSSVNAMSTIANDIIERVDYNTVQ